MEVPLEQYSLTHKGKKGGLTSCLQTEGPSWIKSIYDWEFGGILKVLERRF
jgi:hypothetical protein